jgi:predicted DNA-binding transcriptional regulator AlpA
MKTKPVPPDALLIDWKQVCTLCQLSKSSFFRMREEGRFPIKPIRLNGSVRYSRKEVVAWIDQKCPPHWKGGV